MKLELSINSREQNFKYFFSFSSSLDSSVSVKFDRAELSIVEQIYLKSMC